MHMLSEAKSRRGGRGFGRIRMKSISQSTLLVRKVSAGKAEESYDVGPRAHLTLVYVVSGGTDAEIIPSVHLSGEYASATVIGLITGTGSAAIRMHTLQHHAAPNTKSTLLVKSTLADTSTISYEGSIRVEPNAQKTDAYQRNENLLLDPESRAVSSPALEILANDVRCTHGAIVKTLDEHELWYLATRGIDRSTARSMITAGFLESALLLIADEDVRNEVETQLR